MSLESLMSMVELTISAPISAMAPTVRAPALEEPAPDTVRSPPTQAAEDWAICAVRGEDPEPPPRRRTFEGTWSKLGNGAWGLRVQGSCQVGDVVRARRKNGALAVVRVGRVVLRNSNPDVTVCEVAR